MTKNLITILVWVLTSSPSIGQNTIGIPDIINHSRYLYEAGASSWDIGQDQNGTMYFANSEGLLSYDGHYWNKYEVPNRTMLRSLAVGDKNRIYAGSQDDFGFFAPDSIGKLQFHSLVPLIPLKSKFFNGVWDIVVSGDDVFFKSAETIFQYDQKELKTYPSAGEWRFLGKHHTRLIAQDSRNGLLVFDNGIWTPFLRNAVFPSDYSITSIVPMGSDSSLVTTLKNGLFILTKDEIVPFNVKGDHPFLQERILSSIPVNKDWFAVGTQTNGCYIIDKNGNILSNFSRREGLQNNNILSLFLDRDNNLWLGLDNGIDFIAYNNAVKHIYPDPMNEGIGYSSMLYNGRLYIGTSTGLYSVQAQDVKDLSTIRGKFTPVPGMRAPAWGLFLMNGHLLLAHHEGAYLISDGSVKPINNDAGYFSFQPFHSVLPSSVVIGGNYNGLDFMEYNNGSFISGGNIPGFKEGSRFFAVDNDGIIWVSHPYKGIYRVEKENNQASTRLYTEKDGLPSTVKNHLFKIRNQIVFTTENGIFEYDKTQDRISASPFFQQLFGRKNIRYLKEDGSGNIWFFENKDLGVADFSFKEPRIIYFPELSGKIVSDFEHIYPYDGNNVFIGADKGFYHINYDLYKKNRKDLQIFIRSVHSSGEADNLLYGGYESGTETPEVSFGNNSLHFAYSSPSYNQQANVEYSYMLEGFDKGWSAWSKKTEKDYTNLPAGRYTFRVKAKTNLGNESLPHSFGFDILPPWYATPLARILYIVLAGAIVLLVYKRLRIIYENQDRKHKEEQKKLQYLHQLEMEKNEKEIVKLKNEKLQAEIEFKNSELASIAMHLVQKSELLSKIRDELVHLRKEMNGESTSADFKKIINTIREEDRMDKDWEQFTIHFDKIQGDFLKSLKQAWPNLSPHELKLCAYLVMNLSSKEIAQLMKISVRGVEISRYRLRKKLQIPTETNLFNFLSEFSASRQKTVPDENGKA